MCPLPPGESPRAAPGANEYYVCLHWWHFKRNIFRGFAKLWDLIASYNTILICLFMRRWNLFIYSRMWTIIKFGCDFLHPSEFSSATPSEVKSEFLAPAVCRVRWRANPNFINVTQNDFYDVLLNGVFVTKLAADKECRSFFRKFNLTQIVFLIISWNIF